MNLTMIMVRLELGRSNAAVLSAAGDLAQRCGARVVAIAVAQPLIAFGGELYGEAIEFDRRQLDKALHAAETEARTMMQDRAVPVEWRSTSELAVPAEFVAREARCADITFSAPDRGAGIAPDPQHLSVADLLMRAGRPLVLVPDSSGALRLEHAMVAWKDTREARRAALDALPLLKLASRVTVVEVATPELAVEAELRLKDLVYWLGTHDIPADLLVQPSDKSDAFAVGVAARNIGADLLVAGAYGHSRAREWFFGGVTTDILLQPARITLLSH